MPNIDLKSQEPNLSSPLNLHYFCASEQAISNQQPDEIAESTRTEATANLAAKKTFSTRYYDFSYCNYNSL